MRQRRAEICEQERVGTVTQIGGQLTTLPEWQRATVVASYMAYGSELDLTAIDTVARDSGKTVVYPRVISATQMVFHPWQPGEPIQRSDKGLQEPMASASVVAAEAIEFFLIPLLACDPHGGRLGYGGGFYDRILAASKGFRCGLGFSWQLVDELPREGHDQRLEVFISESGITRLTTLTEQ